MPILPQAQVAKNKENYDNDADDVKDVTRHNSLLAIKSAADESGSSSLLLLNANGLPDVSNAFSKQFGLPR
jgi:hypothetical protein